MRCPNCGFEDPEDFVFCSECGHSRVAAPSSGHAPGPREQLERGGHAPHYPPGPPMVEAAVGYGSAPAGGVRSARLVGLEGPVEGQEFVLQGLETGIGRRSDCEIVVSDPSVSRLHARIRVVPGGYVLEDAGSSNGTWVNGVRVAVPQPLVERDVVRIGKAAFTFHAAAHTPGLPPGSETKVLDLGDEPSPFGDSEQFFDQDDSPPERFVEPARRDERPTPSMPASELRDEAASDDEIRQQLSTFRRDLAPFIQRLYELSELIESLDQQLATRSGGSSGLAELTAEVEVAGGLERLRQLERLLDELRGDPTDLKLLLRLSDELPTIARLVQFYLRALALVREQSS